MTTLLEKARLPGRWRGGVPKMPIRERGCDAAALGTLKKPVLHEKRLVDLLDRRRVLADRGADVVQAYRTSLELLNDRLEDPGIHVVQAKLVDVDHAEELR